MSHVLIVDDNPDNVAVMAQMLTMQGIPHTTLLDPTQVTGFLEQNKMIDLIFLDLEMPKLNGYQVLESIKSNSKLSHILVVAHTVHTAEIQTARASGFDGFLAKPLNIDEFQSQLEAILAGQAIWVS
ncbi:MAG: response regulator [Chloroflexota bacterium]